MAPRRNQAEAPVVLLFPPFSLDAADARLWRGPQVCALRPKSLAVLHYLAAHAGRLVTKDELLDAVWPGVHVGEAVLKVAVQDIRRALGDPAEAPRFIASVHRHGYRFIARVTTEGPPVARTLAPPQRDVPPPSLPSLVGRDAELARLHALLGEALGGERRIALVTGESGIGKSLLVDVFLAALAARADLWVARGQCVRQYGPGEPYLPVLEAFGSLCRAPDAEPVQAALDRYAPTWLAQLPTLLSEAELDALQRRVAGMAPERMLRQMAEAVEALTAERALVLAFDDLQWSDRATLELIDTLARRQARARLLVVGAYRPAEVSAADHPLAALKQDLHLRGRCEELALAPLPQGAVAVYCAARFSARPEAPARSLDALPRLIHERTGGHPLFMAAVADDLVRRGVIVHRDGRWDAAAVHEVAIPAGVREFIEREVERLLPDQQRVVEAASVAGLEFSSATVAAALGAEAEEVEAWCMDLARRQRFLRTAGVREWPDGTVAARFAFRHDLYREGVYRRLTAGRRCALHRRIGEWRERTYGERAPEIAATLAVHFEEGRDHLRAALYRRYASERAQRRHAPREAVEHARKGLALIERVPPGPERARQELALQVALGAPIAATKSWAAPELEEAYDRARSLAEEIGEAPQLFPMLWGVWAFNVLRARHERARELSEELMELARGAGDDGLLLEAHAALGLTHAWLGAFETARLHLEEAVELYDPHRHRSHAFDYGQDPRVLCLEHAAWVLWWLGRPEQALAASQEAIAWARQLSHPHSLAHALGYAAFLHQFRREPQAVQAFADEALELATEHGFGQWVAFATFLRGWALVAQGRIGDGIGRMREGLSLHRATGAEWGEPLFLALLAEACGNGDRQQREEAPRLLADALAVIETTRERFCEAEVHRLAGECAAVRGEHEVAEACFRRSLAIARRQRARSWELRAGTSLARLLQGRSEFEQARTLLAPVYEGFTEGLDTADLRRARAALEGRAPDDPGAC